MNEISKRNVNVRIQSLFAFHLFNYKQAVNEGACTRPIGEFKQPTSWMFVCLHIRYLKCAGKYEGLQGGEEYADEESETFEERAPEMWILHFWVLLIEITRVFMWEFI